MLAALLAYDSILTLPDEVDFIWLHKLSISSAVFITNRIAALLTVLYLILLDVGNVRRAFGGVHHFLTALLGVSLPKFLFLTSRGLTRGS